MKKKHNYYNKHLKIHQLILNKENQLNMIQDYKKYKKLDKKQSNLFLHKNDLFLYFYLFLYNIYIYLILLTEYKKLF